MTTLIVGYGTLLKQASLGDTVGQDAAAAKARRPVVVPGWRRLFNLRPEHYPPARLHFPGDVEAAAANIEPCPGARFNGLAFEVTDREAELLDARERYYRRVEVPLVDFATGLSLGTGHAYATPADSPWVCRDPGRLLPLWRDLTWARDGCHCVSAAFGRLYEQTTFLADGLAPAWARFMELEQGRRVAA